MGNKTNAYKSRVTSFNKKALLTKKLFFLFLLDLSRKDDPINQLDPLSHLDDERDWSLRRSRSRSRSRLVYANGKTLLCREREETWDQARATCQQLGGDLAQIQTVYDQKAVA